MNWKINQWSSINGQWSIDSIHRMKRWSIVCGLWTILIIVALTTPSCKIYRFTDASVDPNWKTFGSGGHIAKPSMSQFEAFQYREKESPNGHSILTQSLLRANSGEIGTLPKNPHQLPLKKGLISVNSNFIPVLDSPTSSPICYENLSIAHYLTRSQEEWIFKCSKGRADVVNGYVDINEFNSRNQGINEIFDPHAFEIFRKYSQNWL